MSLSYEKQTEDDIPLAIDLDTQDIVYYTRDIDDDDSSEDDTEIDEEELEELHRILDEYKGIKYRPPHVKTYLKIRKKVLTKNIRKIKGENFMPLPLDNKNEDQVQHFHITGQQGSGKSHFASQFIELYMDKFPDNDVYVFSKKKEDILYDKYEKILRVPLDEDFLEAELDTENLSNALVIFDDVEQIHDDEIRKKVYKLKDDISETGRCQHIFIITITHLPLNNRSTRTANSEMTAAVVFPASTKYHSRNLLEKYIGISKEDTKRILEMRTRWVFVNKSIPSCIIRKKKIELL